MLNSEATTSSIPSVGTSTFSKYSTRVFPVYQPSFSASLRTTLVPSKPEMGMKSTMDGLYPTSLKYSVIWRLMSLNRDSDQFSLSILLTTTHKRSTPKFFAKMVCSLVCPSMMKPDSNSPAIESTTSNPKSACETPLIIWGTKSLWPGASMAVKRVVFVSKLVAQMSTVTPRERSSDVWSMTHARANEPLPDFSASRTSLLTVFASTTPRSNKSRPMRVDLPASTWPITTNDLWGLASFVSRADFNSMFLNGLVSLAATFGFGVLSCNERFSKSPWNACFWASRTVSSGSGPSKLALAFAILCGVASWLVRT